MKKETKKTVKKDETKKVEVKEPVNETVLTDEQLKEIKKEADKSFNKKYTNKKKIAIAALCLLGLGTVGTVTPIIVSNANAKVDITVKSSNTAMEKYKVKVKKGTKISKIKVVELEGYDFVGFFKDEACTKAYKSSDTLKKDATIYASYKVKSINNTSGEIVTPEVSEPTVYINGQGIKLPSFANLTIGEAIKEIATLPYETSGVVYLDEACTQEADLNTTMTASTTLYTKAATLNKLSFTWNSTTSSWGVAGANGSIAGEVVIPASYTDGTNDGSVNLIDIGAFSYNDRLTSIIIPSSVTSIGDIAFNGCSGLTSIEIPNSVTSIGYKVFSGSGLTTVTIPSSLGFLSEEAFSYCSLTSIEIPNSVTSIGSSAFEGCSGLTSITVETGNTKYHSSGNCLIQTVSKKLILGCNTSVIPSDGSVTSIEEGAFYGCSGLTQITIPNSVTVILNYAFYNCEGLTSITVEAGNSVYHSSGNCIIETASKTLIQGCKTSVIPTDGSVTTIGSSAFWSCSGLTTITIPNSVTTIGDGAFSGCSSLKSVTIDSATIANNIKKYYTNGALIQGATTIYIKSGLNTASSTYLTSNYTKQATSDKDGYDKWVKNT